MTRYGDGNYERAQLDGGPLPKAGAGPALSEERWTWQDTFTTQVLRREVQEEAWTLIRQSRVYEAQRLQQDKRERDEARSAKVRAIKLD